MTQQPTEAQPSGAERDGAAPVGADGTQGRLPLSALLSQALVAFTVEFDNEAEHRMPHSTTDHGSSAGAPDPRPELHRTASQGPSAGAPDPGPEPHRSPAPGRPAGAPDPRPESHRTTSQGVSAGGRLPWLVSLVMWENCLRHLPDDGITVAGLAQRARTSTNLDGMRRWGYIRIDPPPPRKPGPRSVLHPTQAAGVALELWHPVMDTVQSRWRSRFGGDEVAALRDSLSAIAARLPGGLPDCLPILGHGLYTRGHGPGDDDFPGLRFPEPGTGEAAAPGEGPEPEEASRGGERARVQTQTTARTRTRSEAQAEAAATTETSSEDSGEARAGAGTPAGKAAKAGRREPGPGAALPLSALPLSALPLPALLSRVLLAFAVEFERETATSLAISANVLRVLSEDDWIPVRDLPALSGVSKESIAMATGFLVRNGRAETGPVPPPGRGQRIRLTAAGRRAKDRYGRLTAAIEDRWRARWGDAPISGLRALLECLAGPPGGPSPLMQGLEPYPDNWRAKIKPPRILPHYPMVLHRGGYPDGR
jgi:hypothetical protein